MVKKYNSGFSFRFQNETGFRQKHTIKNIFSPKGKRSNLKNPKCSSEMDCCKKPKTIAVIVDSNNHQRKQSRINCKRIFFCFRHMKAHHVNRNSDLILTHTKTLLCIRCKGSLTVEAAFAGPIFILCLVLFLGLFRVLSVEAQVNEALTYTASKLAMESLDTAADTAITDIVERYQGGWIFRQQLKMLGCQEESVVGGYTRMTVSNHESDGLFVRLTVSYNIRLPVHIFGKKSISVVQSAVARRWNGADQSDAVGAAWVYVTPYGTVYHRTLGCPYLDLSVWSVPTASVKELRNKNGGKYYTCTRCQTQNVLEQYRVYVTDYGTLYHSSMDCSALKRTVYRVSLDQAGGRRLCQKCR